MICLKLVTNMLNKKVIITGHTSGIGNCIYENLLNTTKYIVTGMSRTNGYDLNNLEYVFSCIIEIDPDIIINNAYVDIMQTKLLLLLRDKYKYEKKLIINIGSAAALILPDNKDYNNSYVKNKRDQKYICREYNYNYTKTDFNTIQMKLSNLMFDYVDTPFKSIYNKQIYPNLLTLEVFNIVKYIMDTLDSNICIQEMIVHSTRPPKIKMEKL